MHQARGGLGWHYYCAGNVGDFCFLFFAFYVDVPFFSYFFFVVFVSFFCLCFSPTVVIQVTPGVLESASYLSLFFFRPWLPASRGDSGALN